jgi:hypothetical protein
MNETNRDSRTKGTAPGDARSVEERIGAASASTRRAIRTNTLLGIAAVGVIVGWGRWLYASVSQVDATYVAAYARERVEASLPAAHDLFADHLRKAAPTVVQRALDHLLLAPAVLTERLEGVFTEEVDRLAAVLEAELTDRLRGDIAAARRHLDTKMAGMSDRERLDYVAREFVQDYRRNVERVLHHHAGPYSASMETLRRDIDRLGTTQQLTEGERLQREILAVFLELHRRAVARGEEGIFQGGLSNLFGRVGG